jgi:signal transduction histidine kinase/ActR/RegA family two-component response regulator
MLLHSRVAGPIRKQNEMIRPSPIQGAIAIAILVAALFGASQWAQRNVGPELLPHGFCFTWMPALLWLHVISDALIGLAYVSIPITLWMFVRKRADLPFSWIFVLFGLFIVSCGVTHFMGIWTIWRPDYWLDGSLKAFTAAVSVLTAISLVMLVPKALALPTVERMRQTNEALQAEVAARRIAEEELRRAHAELERRVHERTCELAQAKGTAEAARADAESANRLKDQFLARVSHELRTPLQSTISWAQVLARKQLDPAQARGAIERLIHNVRAQARLIDDLLDISRILSGNLRLELVHADPAAIVERAIDVVRPAAQARNVTIDWTIDLAGTRITTDPTRLEQVIWNLLNNAVQASADGGRVALAARASGGRLHLRVQDWGHGIDPATLPRMFEPFQRGAYEASGHRGLGLGLAITRSIVMLLGGEVSARSVGVGHGASFDVRLPLDAGAVTGDGAGGDELPAADQAVVAGLRVLYVEDDHDVADAGRITLGDLGMTVDVCYDFDAALAAVRAGRFDVLLSDLNLGGASGGSDLVRAMRAVPATRSTPAIALSAFGGPQDVRATTEAGFDAHLVKPVSAIEVARALAAVVASRRAALAD